MLALAVSCLAFSTASGAARHAKRSSVYWGATIGSQLTGGVAPYDMKAVTKFQHVAGKGLSTVGFTAPFSVCNGTDCSPYLFPDTPMENLRQYGAIPFLSWGSEGAGGSTQPDFQLSDVINGRYDSYIANFAAKARAWGHPFFLRFDWEMNGNWFPWGERANGNKPGEYVAAYRHVHDIFTAMGATNATWVWCPNVNINNAPAIQRPLGPLYPGNGYVDWTCLDGFNWGKNLSFGPGPRSFSGVFGRTYHQVVQVARHKPMILGEVASTGIGGGKPGWVRNMLRTIPHRYPKIHGFIWFDVNDRGTQWPIETSRHVVRAFRHGIRSHVYTSNSFAGLNASPIPVP